MAARHDVTTAPRGVDLAHARWRKSSYSGGANDCVEVAELDEHAAVRDSKDIGRRPLLFSKVAMRALVSGIVYGSIGERQGWEWGGCRDGRRGGRSALTTGVAPLEAGFSV
ncbi:DUF397 domain-containing protein [Streptomyces sp. ActVer]|nr:DUF397 domain-containing protein [Streptomyces sp. ActVer]MCZ4506743.1 DUF397 domain-containing protein [Streptomyces sp. ActVer]